MSRAVSTSARVLGFDLARSFAIATMVLINFQVYLLRSPGGELGEIWYRWLAHAPSGRSSATFVILAGCGIAQMSRRALSTDDRAAWWAVRRTLFYRSIFLFVAGNLLILVWSIDILHHYAFYLLFAIPFVRARGSILLGSAAAILALTTVGAATMPWIEEIDLDYHTPLGMASNVLATGIHPIFPWLSFVLYGMWLGRQPLGELALRRRFLLAGAASAVAAELLALALGTAAVRGLLPVPTEAIALLGTSWSPEPLYVVGACSTSTVVVALGHEIALRWPNDRLVRALISTGQLSLSIYLLHALVGVGVPRWLFHWENGLTIELVVAWWAIFITAVVLAAATYRRFLARGPVEAVMRFLTGTGDERGSPAIALARRLARAALDVRRQGLQAMRLSVERELADAAARSLDRAADMLRSSAAADGPRAIEPDPATVPVSVPGAAVWAVVAVGATVVLVARIAGTSPPALACPAPAALAIGASTTGQLTMLCPRVHFDLTVDAREGVLLETRSGTDVLVEVFRPDGELVASDDDGGPGLDARVHTVLLPGHYDVLVRPYSATSGPFVLSAAELPAPGGPPR